MGWIFNLAIQLALYGIVSVYVWFIKMGGD